MVDEHLIEVVAVHIVNPRLKARSLRLILRTTIASVVITVFFLTNGAAEEIIVCPLEEAMKLLEDYNVAFNSNWQMRNVQY
jgi:hypothetical protein